MKENIFFDLTKGYPQVLLLGNGLTRKNGVKLANLLKKCVKKGADGEKYYNETNENFHIPNSIFTLALMDCDDKTRHKRYSEEIKYKYKQNEKLEKLIGMPFDAILTTNYTYELESIIKSDYHSLSEHSKRRYSKSYGKDPKYLIHTYNSIENSPEIWHIHGELRRPSSLIMSYDEYIRLTNKIVEFCKSRKDDYQVDYNNVQIKSWVDYFIIGDLYILGFGFDYSEFDLWWLINRRLREKAKTGNIYFYEPEKESNKYKLMAMKDMGIVVESLDVRIQNESDDNTAVYQEFYDKAIADISQKIETNRRNQQ